MRIGRWIALALALGAGPLAAAPEPVGPAAATPVLPPLAPWDGASRALIVADDDPWITPSEQSGLERTPRYDETFAWLRRLVEAAPELEMVSLGSSPEGRAIWMVIASREGAATVEELHRSGKPVLLAHAGIHSGEIDGKDAGLMLLRDLTVGGRLRDLLDGASLLFIPILNVDGHERFSAHGRINQRGPLEMGWRTNSRNLNLNRDFAKLDTPEVRALVGAFDRWRPDLYIDLHVTDGADYQYDVTWGYNGAHAWSPRIATWLDERFTPASRAALAAAGHRPGPLVFGVEPRDLTRGNLVWSAGPRFSNGYADARHLPGVLVENHSLKPYDRRVLGTYVLLRSALETLAVHGTELREAVAADRARPLAEVPLGWRAGAAEGTMELAGIEQRLELSPVSGGLEPVWTGVQVTLEVPRVPISQPTATVRAARAYWLPPAWADVGERLRLHGIEMEELAEPREVEVEMYRLGKPRFDETPFEGRVRVEAEATRERRSERMPRGSLRIPTDQPLGLLATLLLEPACPDSLFQWGFFHSVLSRVEYAESYVMEPMARRMLAEDPELAAEYREKLLRDADFAASSRDRLQWFYERTPFFDERWRLYPVARELSESD